jgi:hypothetical protein
MELYYNKLPVDILDRHDFKQFIFLFPFIFKFIFSEHCPVSDGAIHIVAVLWLFVCIIYALCGYFYSLYMFFVRIAAHFILFLN